MKEIESLWPEDFAFGELIDKEHPVHILYAAGEELRNKTQIPYSVKRSINPDLDEIVLDLNLATANFPLFGLVVQLDKKYPVIFRDYVLAKNKNGKKFADHAYKIQTEVELKEVLRHYFKSDKVMNIVGNLMHCLRDMHLREMH